MASSSFTSMFLIPKNLYETLMSRADRAVQSHCDEFNVRQINTFDVNSGGRVTIRNDENIKGVKVAPIPSSLPPLPTLPTSPDPPMPKVVYNVKKGPDPPASQIVHHISPTPTSAPPQIIHHSSPPPQIVHHSSPAPQIIQHSLPAPASQIVPHISPLRVQRDEDEISVENTVDVQPSGENLDVFQSVSANMGGDEEEVVQHPLNPSSSEDIANIDSITVPSFSTPRPFSNPSPRWLFENTFVMPPKNKAGGKMKAKNAATFYNKRKGKNIPEKAVTFQDILSLDMTPNTTLAETPTHTLNVLPAPGISYDSGKIADLKMDEQVVLQVPHALYAAPPTNVRITSLVPPPPIAVSHVQIPSVAMSEPLLTINTPPVPPSVEMGEPLLGINTPPAPSAIETRASLPISHMEIPSIEADQHLPEITHASSSAVVPSTSHETAVSSQPTINQYPPELQAKIKKVILDSKIKFKLDDQIPTSVMAKIRNVVLGYNKSIQKMGNGGKMRKKLDSATNLHAKMLTLDKKSVKRKELLRSQLLQGSPSSNPVIDEPIILPTPIQRALALPVPPPSNEQKKKGGGKIGAVKSSRPTPISKKRSVVTPIQDEINVEASKLVKKLPKKKILAITHVAGKRDQRPTKRTFVNLGESEYDTRQRKIPLKKIRKKKWL